VIIAVVKKRFKGFSVDASVRFGSEFVVLTGPNGSGKTTLLRAIAGLERPDEGRIAAFGRTLFDGAVNVPTEERNVGYVFQDSALFPWLTVEGNIRFGLRATDATAEDWLRELSEKLELGDLMGRYPRNLSGGEAQRVALGRALVTRPEILLLDEPLSAVDMEMRPRLRGFLLDLQRSWEIPVVMVTHDYAEMHTMADRVICLDRGRVMDEKKREMLGNMPMVSY
jgi:molybdate transport system ATP-binding protein